MAYCTCKIRSPSLIRPSLAAMLLGLTCTSKKMLLPFMFGRIKTVFICYFMYYKLQLANLNFFMFMVSLIGCQTTLNQELQIFEMHHKIRSLQFQFLAAIVSLFFSQEQLQKAIPFFKPTSADNALVLLEHNAF